MLTFKIIIGAGLVLVVIYPGLQIRPSKQTDPDQTFEAKRDPEPTIEKQPGFANSPTQF